jgi:hypothetical protein
MPALCFAAPVADEGPKPWPQFACDVAHSSIALDTWDFASYKTPSWILTMKGTSGFSRNPVIDKGMLAIADSERVYCVDVISGNQKWASQLSSECGGSCAIVGDRVLVPTTNRIVAYDLVTGEAKSSLETGGTPSSPTFYQDELNTFFYYGTSGKPGYAAKFDMNSGRKRWELQQEWGCPGPIGINLEYGYAGIASHYKILLANEAYGSIETEIETGTQSFAATSAIDKYCVYTMSGGEIFLLPKPYAKWNPNIIDCGGFTFWPPAQFSQTLIQGTQDGRLVRFDLTGKVIWDKKMPATVTNGCTVMGEHVLVPVGGSDKTKSGVYILKAETGDQVEFINIQSEYIFQPVVAWDRMFVEYGKNDKYTSRWLACYGKKPRSSDEEPKLTIKNGKFDVEVGWMGEVLKQVSLTNDGKVPIDLILTGENLMQPTVDTMTLAPKTTETLRVKVFGKNKPGKYTAKINCHILDPDYGDQSLGYITANITIKDTPPPPPPEQPPNPPKNLQARVVYDYIQLEWQQPDKGVEPLGYNVFRTVGIDPFPQKPLNKDKIVDLTYADTEVIPGLKYTYKVVALGKAGLVSDPSNTASAEIPIKLMAVKNLKAQRQGDGVLLTWESEQPVTFLIERDGAEIGMTSNLLFADSNPPAKKLIYKVYPKKENLIGPEAFTIIDMSPEKEPDPDPKPDPDPNPDPNPDPEPKPPVEVKIVVEFTVGKEIALVNGVAKFSGAIPYVKSGRTMVPFRFLGESIGAKVSYTTDPQTKKVLTVTYELDGKTVTLVMGSKTAVVGESTVELDVPPEIQGGKTYVPLRFVTAALGGTVEWDAAAKKATITYVTKK